MQTIEMHNEGLDISYKAGNTELQDDDFDMDGDDDLPSMEEIR